MKRLIYTAMCLLVLVGTIGCGRKSETEKEPSEPEKKTSTEIKKEEPVEKDETAGDKDERTKAFHRIMLDFESDWVLPGFTKDELKPMEGSEEFASRSFALGDVNCDGEDELIVYNDPGSTAGMISAIYGYDDTTANTILELCEAPSLRFYQNGTIAADWTHNQGMSGDFWPYSIYRYKSEDKMYDLIGDVDAYDRSIYENNKEEFSNMPYPYDIDRSNSGFVYYIHDAGEIVTDIASDEAVDEIEYNAWLKDITGDSGEINFIFFDVTQDKINKVFSGE